MSVDIRLADLSNIELFRSFFNIYQNELSVYMDGEYSIVDDNGYFDYNTVSEFFSKDNVFPYLITNDKNIVGVVIVSKPPYVKKGCDFCIQELFVLNYYRGKDVAIKAIDRVFTLHPGKYCLAVLKKNERALRFWHKMIKDKINIVNDYREKDIIYEFEVKE